MFVKPSLFKIAAKTTRDIWYDYPTFLRQSFISMNCLYLTLARKSIFDGNPTNGPIQTFTRSHVPVVVDLSNEVFICVDESVGGGTAWGAYRPVYTLLSMCKRSQRKKKRLWQTFVVSCARSRFYTLSVLLWHRKVDPDVYLQGSWLVFDLNLTFSQKAFLLCRFERNVWIWFRMFRHYDS